MHCRCCMMTAAVARPGKCLAVAARSWPLLTRSRCKVLVVAVRCRCCTRTAVAEHCNSNPQQSQMIATKLQWDARHAAFCNRKESDLPLAPCWHLNIKPCREQHTCSIGLWVEGVQHSLHMPACIASNLRQFLYACPKPLYDCFI